MKTTAFGLILTALAVLAQAPGPNPNSQYRLGPDSMQYDDVPHGEIRGPYTLPSAIRPRRSPALMVFQDGQAFKEETGDLRSACRT